MDRTTFIDYSDVMVAVVSDGNPSVPVNCYVGWITEVGVSRGAVVASVGAGAVAGDGGNLAVGSVNAADSLVPAVSEVDRTVNSDIDSQRAAQEGSVGWPAITNASAAQDGVSIPVLPS